MPAPPLKTYSGHTLKKFCDQLRDRSAIIATLHQRDGYPPYWKRENSFESLCKTIIEQQVSLSSARSVFTRLSTRYGSLLPEILSALSPDEYRLAGVTRQKAGYLKLLAQHVLDEPGFFPSLEKLPDALARQKLISLKGIGAWTANVYMLLALNRSDLYPDQDVALIKSIAYEAFEGRPLSNAEAAAFIGQFAPLRSIACLYFYHAYILRKKVAFVP